MTGTVWEVQFTDEDFHIDSNQLLYEECLERVQGALKKEELEKELEEEQHPRVRTTSSGRILN